jgi:putative endopeptidase
MEKLVKALEAAMAEDIQQLPWMSAETKVEAEKKLRSIRDKIGYPENWRDYSKFEVKRDDLVGNADRQEIFEYHREVAKLGKPVDEREWGMTPPTVNAYYSASMNDINFPAGILQPPFFDNSKDPAVNFGGIGVVIGHEMTHGFDDQGSKYDADGNRRDWWTEADLAAFQAKTKQLIDQFNGLVPEGLDPKYQVDGALTVGENLADLRGLQIACAAYRIAAKRDGIEPDYQQMFLSYARGWREKQTEEASISSLQDVHSPSEFRCNQVVRNIAEFYNTYGVKEGDKLFMPENQRITL